MANQIELVTAILKELERQGLTLNCRQMNAAITAADAIISEIESPHRAATPGMGPLVGDGVKWLLGMVVRQRLGDDDDEIGL